MDKTWILRTDKGKEADIREYQSKLALDPSYNPQNELKDDQKTIKIITDQIKSVSFAKASQRLPGVIVSEYDDAREAEHYRYQEEIRAENEKYDIIFKDKLMTQKTKEIKIEEDIKYWQSIEKESDESKQRKEFLHNWKYPEINEQTEDNIKYFVSKWNEYERYKKERRILRKMEKELETEIGNENNNIN